MTDDSTKWCSKCGEEKALGEFHRDKTGKQGRASRCAKCSLAEHAQYYKKHSVRIKASANEYRLNNLEKTNEDKREYYQKNRVRLIKKQRQYYEDNREAVLGSGRDYYSKNKDARNKYRRKYRLEHPEKEKMYGDKYQNTHRDEVRAARVKYRSRNPNKTNEWRAANPDKARAISQRRKANKRSVKINDFTADQWTWLKEQYEGKCAYCGCVPNKLTVDHIIPISRGGNNTLSNAAPACQSCNSRKGGRTPEEAGMKISVVINILEQSKQGKLF